MNNSIHFDNLRERQERFFELFQGMIGDEIAAAEKKVEIRKKQYEVALAELERVSIKRTKYNGLILG